MSKLLAPVLAAVLACTAGLAHAQSAAAASAGASNWDKQHPRRAEVNARLANQNKRVKQEVAEGEMSKGKAAKIHKEDKAIRQEERDMAAQNGGHITKSEQKVLNQQENQVSKQIGK